MVVRLIALYGPPRNVDTFDTIYFGQHIPIVKTMPGLRKLEVNRIAGALRGDASYYLIATLSFDDEQAMSTSLASEEGRSAARVLRDAGAAVTMLFAAMEEV